MADAHGMRLLLYRFLSRAEGNVGRNLVRPTFPDHVTSVLQEFTQRNLRKNLLVTGELVILLRLFVKHGVNVIPFKGPTLAALAYGDLGLREFGDLDLLIARPDFMMAITPSAADWLFFPTFAGSPGRILCCARCG
jgi:putative nucleotidyltransferase-like protein